MSSAIRTSMPFSWPTRTVVELPSGRAIVWFLYLNGRV